jgi:hypothetical protein
MNEHPRTTWWVENLLRPALIAGMVVCLAAPAVVLLEWIFTDWGGAYFLVFAFVASLEGILSERALQKRRISGWEYLGSRTAELLILLIVLKLISYLPAGLDQLWIEAQAWASDPGLIVNNIDFFTSLLLLALWSGSIYIGRLVRELDADKDPPSAPPDRADPEYYRWLTQPRVTRDRQESLYWLADMILWGGIVLLGVAALLQFVQLESRIPAMATVIYFALAVILLSQARFGVTHTRWRAEGLPVQPGMGRRWLLWGMVFVLGVALVALVLPTSYSMGPLQALLSLYSFLTNIVIFLFGLLVFLLSLPFALLLPSVERPPLPSFPAFETLPQEPVPGGGTPPWLDTLLSAAFWLVVFSIVIYALYRVLRDRFGELDESEAAAGTWWGRLLLWFRDLWRRWLDWRRGVQVELGRRLAQRRLVRPTLPSPGRFLSLRSLAPRDLIYYFYLSVARRAAAAGQRRQPGQTPYEYQSELDRRFPDLEPDLSGLTEAFVRARYSSDAIEEETADAVKPLWQRIKTALRRHRGPP